MAPKRRLEDDHDDTDHDTGHSSTDRPPAKKTTSKLLRSLPDQADTLGAAPIAASMSNAASDSDVTEEPTTTTADNGLDVTPTHEPPKRIMNVWTHEEIEFLTLVYEKLELIRSEDDSFMITNNNVYEAYERHFGTGRDRKSIYMRLFRRDGSRLDNLYQQHGAGKKKTAGRKLYKLNITQEELDAYVKDGHVSSNFTESDAANPSQPASVTATEDGISSPLNSSIAGNLTENPETQEPQAEPSEIHYNAGQSTRQAQDLTGTQTPTLLVNASTQTEHNWAPDTPYFGS